MEVLLAVLGCVLGYAGWRKGQRALAEVAALRAWIEARGLAGAAAEPGVAGGAGPGVAAAEAAVPDVPLWAPEPVVAAEFGAAVPGGDPVPGVVLPGADPAPAGKRIDIEQLLAQRWGVWLGAVALLLSGVFLVRTAVEQGWLGPAERCAVGAVLGLALVGGGLWARRRPARVGVLADQVPAALAGGGVAVLFAAAYGAGPLYGLVSETAGFVLLAAAALAGLALSLLFGPMVAGVGLVAAFVTPLLVQTVEPSLPGLFGYLLVVSAACWAVVRVTAWTWLGWSAAVAGAGWVLLTALGTAWGPAVTGVWAPGLFVPASAALTLGLLPGAALEHRLGRRFAWAPMLMLGLAGLVLLALTGDGWVRAGLLLLGPVAIAKAWTEPRLAWLPMVAAGLSILTLLLWAVPGWAPTDEEITIEGVVQAVLPGSWAPAAILPFLQAALGVGVLYAAAGVWKERRDEAPLAWAGLVAGVPLLVLATAYVQVGRFQPRLTWAVAAVALGAALVWWAGRARRSDVAPLQRAGVHAAGAVGALALGCAILLDAAWLTVALALMLPALAWIEGAAALAALRRVAGAVAGTVLVRLLLNPWVPEYDFGSIPVFNLLLVAYGIPAVCFGVASVLFRRRADDWLVTLLETGACVFLALLLVLEVRHAAVAGDMQSGRDPLFAEFAWWTSVLGGLALALLALARRSGRRVPGVAWRVIGLVALVLGVGLLVFNPFLVGESVGRGVLWNLLVPAYLAPAGLAVAAVWLGARPRGLLGLYAVLAALMWVSGLVRQVFHPGLPGVFTTPIVDAELWALSGAWALLAAGVMAAGLWLRFRPLRLAALALVVLVVAKVFLVDMSGLEGLWRVLSFLGLGLGLIGLGGLYRRFGSRI